MTITLDDLAFLTSSQGQTLLTSLHGEDLRDTALLGMITTLRKSYTGDQARAAVEMARLRAQAQDRNVTFTRDVVILNVRRAYFSILRAGALVQVAEQTVKNRQVLFDQVEELAKNRLKSDLDVRFASVNLADAKLLRTTCAKLESATLHFLDLELAITSSSARIGNFFLDLGKGLVIAIADHRHH